MPYADPERNKAYQKEYAEKHREEAREYMRAYSKRPENVERARHYTRSPETKERARLARATPAAKLKLRDRQLRHEFGITLKDWEMLWEKQAGLCGVCGKPLSRDRNTHVDHDHETDRVRGLLHVGCNTKLAAVEDATFLAGALAYLEASRGPC